MVAVILVIPPLKAELIEQQLPVPPGCSRLYIGRIARSYPFLESAKTCIAAKLLLEDSGLCFNLRAESCCHILFRRGFVNVVCLANRPA